MDFPEAQKIDFEMDQKTWRTTQTKVFVEFPRKIDELQERVEKLERNRTTSNVKHVTDLIWWLGFFGAYTYILTKK